MDSNVKNYKKRDYCGKIYIEYETKDIYTSYIWIKEECNNGEHDVIFINSDSFEKLDEQDHKFIIDEFIRLNLDTKLFHCKNTKEPSNPVYK